jgi:hypothetical protein
MGRSKAKPSLRKGKAFADEAQTCMTPHLAPDHDSSGGLQDLQSTTAAASISTAAASSIAAIAAIVDVAGAATTIPIGGEVGVADTVDGESVKEVHGDGKAAIAAIAVAATTAPIVGEVGVADGTVEDKSVNEGRGNGVAGDADSIDMGSPKEYHGDGEVRDADPANDQFAMENHGDGEVGINLSNTYNWIIEGVEGLDEESVRHMNAFYALLRKWFGSKEYTSQLITKEDYNARVNFLLRVNEGDTDCREGFLTGNTNAYKWLKRYHVYKYGDDSAVLVLRPKKIGAIDVTKIPLSNLQQPTYMERLFIDLWKIHQSDHCKGITFFYRVRDKHGNVTREVCKLFTDVCPHCIGFSVRKRPTAGIQPIVTLGMCVRGQTDIIDFQSMPDGAFKFLLNYIDHGVKKLTCIPITSKRASCVAFALFTIFTETGPPSILQTDNGGEFSNHAHDHVGRRLVLEDEFIDLVIQELKNLWPECQMVRGSPRHSESNGGVERVNQTVQRKLSGWMKTNKSKHWSVGCKIVQWRVNTQFHSTIKDTPYHLVYGMHPRVGISNLPISPCVLSNLVDEAQLNQVYCTMIADNPGKNTAQLPQSFQDQVAAVAEAANKEALVSLPPIQFKATRKRHPEEINKEIRGLKRAMTKALEDAVLSNSTDSHTTPPAPTDHIVGQSKSSEGTIISNRWLELYEERDGPDQPVTLPEIQKAKLRAMFPIVYNTNNKDITDDDNWAPCILIKVRKEQYEVLDINGDLKVDEDIEWEGDDGLSSTWSMYHKYPSTKFVDSYRTRLEIAAEETEYHAVSPRRKNLRDKAAANLTKKGETIRNKLLTNSPQLLIKTGDVVMVPLDDVDRTKVDGGSLCGVVVSINKLNSSCRVAVAHGLLHRAYVYHKLKVLPKASNDIDLNNLRDAYNNYRSLPKLTEREAARYVSSVGGQGIIHCNCRTDCTKNSCSCKKANRLCSSRCHRNNNKCKNKHDDDVNCGK